MATPNQNDFQQQHGDALLIVDVQNDFLPGGSLAVPRGDDVVPVLNRYLKIFAALPVYATRDWHPERHCSFKAEGGLWPPHCVAGTRGAEFAAALQLPSSAAIISKPRCMNLPRRWIGKCRLGKRGFNPFVVSLSNHEWIKSIPIN